MAAIEAGNLNVCRELLGYETAAQIKQVETIWIIIVGIVKHLKSGTRASPSWTTRCTWPAARRTTRWSSSSSRPGPPSTPKM